MRRIALRRALRGQGLLLSALVLNACGDTTSPAPQPTIQVTPMVLSVVVGGTGRFFYTVTNATNTNVNWTTSNASIATVDPTGFVTGRGVGTATISAALVVNPNVKQDLTVNVTAPAPELVLDSIRDGITGQRIFNDTARATFFALFTLHNQQANSRVETRVDARPFVLCQTVATGAQINATGAMQVQIACPINTTELDTAAARRGRPLFPNGTHALNARLVAPNGNAVSNVTKSLAFVNRDQLVASTNATGGDSLSARGPELTITVSPVIFGADTAAALFATLSTASNDSPAPLLFKQTTPTRLPATFTVDTTASLGAEGFFRLTPRVFDQSGSDRTGLYDLNRFLSGVAYDLTPPRLAATEYPPSENIMEYPAVVLSTAAGINAAGDTIALTRITAGVDAAAHPPSCPTRHLHGNISIQRQNSSLIEGPFPDPAAAACGWGEIVVVSDSVLRFNITGLVQERALAGITVRLLLATGACDAGPLVDDVAVPQGTGVGQTPTPVVNFPGTTGGFTAQFQMRIDPSYFGRVVCTFVQANDNRVTLGGQPAPNTTYLVYSSMIKAN